MDRLLAGMTFDEKIGQLNQRLLGWKAVRRRGDGTLAASDELKREIDRWGGLGVLYGLFRADPWSGRDWGNGIRPQERGEAAAVVQETVLARGAHGIGALLSEEAPHGHQALGGTILPTNLALGATFDPDTVREAEAAVAAELAASGVHIALVSGLDIARDPRWGRCEECFGEDPLMAARMCGAIVEGMQGEQRSRIGHGGVAVVLKHLAAQGEAVGGRNGQSAIIGVHDLREIHLPPVEAGVRAGALGFMAAYNDIDSMPCCANPWLLREYLRDELGFDGIVMADGLAVDRLETMTGSIPAAGRAALLAGVDVSLWDQGFASLGRYADDERVVAAVDRSLRRVLDLKARFGLLPCMADDGAGGAIVVDSCGDAAEDTGHGDARAEDGRAPEHARGRARIVIPDGAALDAAVHHTRALSRQLARRCLVLLAGVDSLRLAGRALADGQSGPVVVAGPFADDQACFLGDYTAPLPDGERTTVYWELRRRLGGDRVLLTEDGTGLDADAWRRAAVVVAVVGGTSERSYDSAFADNGAAAAVAEHGATCGEGVDLSRITLPWDQDGLLARLRERTDAPIVTVVVSGRPHVLTRVMETSSATLWAGYAGPFGPEAVVDALLGQGPMPGRLPVTLPASPGAIPVRYNDRQSAADVYRDAEEPVLLPFAHGLGALDGVSVESFDVAVAGMAVRISARLKCGVEPAQGAVTVFARRIGGTRIPRLAELVASAYCVLEAGRTCEFHAEIGIDRLMDPGDDETRVRLWIGGEADRLEREVMIRRPGM